MHWSRYDFSTSESEDDSGEEGTGRFKSSADVANATVKAGCVVVCRPFSGGERFYR